MTDQPPKDCLTMSDAEYAEAKRQYLAPSPQPKREMTLETLKAMTPEERAAYKENSIKARNESADNCLTMSPDEWRKRRDAIYQGRSAL